MTWTRAKRQHVYAKWTRKDPGSSGSAPRNAEEVAGEGSAYLNEIDVAVEALDLIVTGTLLRHVVELVQPLRLLDPWLKGAEGSEAYLKLHSNHSLPMAFISTKNLRLFLVEQPQDRVPEEAEEVQEQFILLNVDSVELSPRVHNPIGRLIPEFF